MKTIDSVKSFLFDNKTTKQTLLKNTFWITLSSFVGRVLGAILSIYVVRLLGPTEYGKFAFALAFVSMFVSFLDFGVSPIATREFTKNKENEKEFYPLLSLRLLLGLITILMIVVGSFFISADPQILKITAILAFFTFVSQLPEFFYAFLTARERFEHISWMSIVQVVLTTGIGFVVIFNLPSAVNISYSYLVAAILALLPVLIFFNFKILPLKITFEIDIWKKFLKLSWPLALISIFGLVYSYIDSIIMGLMGQIIQVGYYSAALKIALFILTPPALVIASFYPVLCRFSAVSKESLQKALDNQTLSVIFLVLPIVVGSVILAPQIIDFFYGIENYWPAVLAFQILAVMTGVSSVYRSFSQILIVIDQQKGVLLITILGALANIILNIILIPRYSFYGAAVASLITHSVIFTLYFIFVLKSKKVKPINLNIILMTGACVVATVIMSFVISLPKIYNLNIFISVSIGAIIYLLSLALARKSVNKFILKQV